MSNNKKLFVALTVFVALLAGTVAFGTVHAASNTCASFVPNFLCAQYNNGANGINTLIKNIITFVFAIAGVVVLAFIIWAGFKFMTSGGDSGKKEEAQKQIVAAVIGLLIIVFSFFIVQLIFQLLGLGNVTSPELPCPENATTINGQPCLGGPST
jgi:hypothetical protein